MRRLLNYFIILCLLILPSSVKADSFFGGGSSGSGCAAVGCTFSASTWKTFLSYSYSDVGAAPAFTSGTANYFWATPNGTTGVPSLRAIVAADIPALSYQATLACTSNYPVLGTGQCGSGALGSNAYTSTAYAPTTVYDTQYFSIDAGVDSVLGAPQAATRTQAGVGSNIPPTPANVSYGTFTINANGYDITTAVYVTGTQTATFTLSGLAVGQLYRFQFTPTVTGQVPTITATSGFALAPVIPTIVGAVVETIYFRASATSAVFTFTNTGASTWSTTATTVYAYAQPAIGRLFSHTAPQTLKFDWMPPLDWDGSTIYWNWTGVVDNATAPANGETIICQLSGVAFSSSDSLSQSMGTAVSSTFTADATYVRYDEILSTLSGAVTIANSPAAGTKVKLSVDCLTTGTYAQASPMMTGITLKYGRTLAH